MPPNVPYFMHNSFTTLSDKKTSETEPVSHDAPPDPALELLRQENKFARYEQFSDAERVFRAAASLLGGKAIPAIDSAVIDDGNPIA